VIILENNKGCKWYIKNDIYAKGYLFDDKNKLYKNQGLITFFEGVRDSVQFLQKLKQANGLFSVIIKYSDGILLAADRARCFSLFYTLKNNNLIVSDRIESIKNKTGSGEIDHTASKIFLATGYVTGEKTLIKNIFQVQAGEYIYFNKGKIVKDFYHTFIPERISDYTNASPVKNFLESLDMLSERTATLLENKVAVIPLSSGYDSRLIVSILKNTGINDAICFTYGRKDNDEIEISRKVAEKTGYKWLFIEYNDELIKGYLDNPVFQEYYKYSANYSAMFFMQEYFAVKFLHENNLIPGNSVFIPGHSGDVLAGGHLWEDINENTTSKNLAKLIYRKNFILNKPSGPVKRDLINGIYKNININSRYPHAVFQNWELKERHAKFIVNSASVYNFFGYEYIMPLWDISLLDFFTSLPYSYRVFKNFYNDVLNKQVFLPAGIAFDSENLPPERSIRIQRYKNKLKNYMPEFLKRPFYHHPDPFYYKEITSFMINDMLEKKYKVNTRVQYENAYIVQWYISKILENTDQQVST
jgi:asparagine synthase (glutamine-hydrolysing)